LGPFLQNNFFETALKAAQIFHSKRLGPFLQNTFLQPRSMAVTNGEAQQSAGGTLLTLAEPGVQNFPILVSGWFIFGARLIFEKYIKTF
jgi:hypothetical protein